MYDYKRVKNAFYNQKSDSRRRKIEFLLTFEEWLKEWEDSGHLHERGRKKGQYVMARYGDRGPYAVGNVKIITCSENRSEAVPSEEALAKMRAPLLGRKMSVEGRNKLRVAQLGKPKTDICKARISAANKGKKRTVEVKKKLSNAQRGRKHSESTKEKQSESARIVWAKRKSSRG